MRKSLFLILLVNVFISTAFSATQEFPIGPNPTLTPGTYCTHPDAYRYKEHIPYCNRNVSRDEKLQIIDNYNTKLGFQISLKNRSDYKIDHLIPLCAGGSNDEANLWPQHKTVYVITDPIEQMVCDKMAKGVLSQKDAIALVFKAKLDLNQAPNVERQLEKL